MRTEQLRCAIVMGVALACLLSAEVGATPVSPTLPALQVCTDEGVCGNARVLGTQQLADVAGKFTIGGEVVGLNLQMASSWQAANGQNLNGKASLALTLPGANGSATPQASVQTQASATNPSIASIPGTGLVSGSKGLDNIAGAAQLVQVAGDNNGASNLTTIDISPRAIVLPAGANTPSAQAIAANGAKVNVDFANNGLALALNVPGAGSAQQRLNTLNANNILQSIQIAADRQQVANQLQLQLQVRPQSATALATQGFGQAINALRGR